MSNPKNRTKLILIGAIFPILIICVWEILVKIDVLPKQSIAAPSQAFIEFWELLSTEYLWRNIGYSIYRLFAGFILGSMAGIILGWFVGYNKLGSKLLEPSFLTFIQVPPIAWIPFLIALFGIGDISTILLI